VRVAQMLLLSGKKTTSGVLELVAPSFVARSGGVCVWAAVGVRHRLSRPSLCGIADPILTIFSLCCRRPSLVTEYRAFLPL
jgi:hypothetical protein